MRRLILILTILLLAGSAFAADKLQIMEAGKIKLEYLPTTDFSVETDPSSPEDGQIWWNETTKQLKIADPLGVYEFNATALTAWDTTPTAFSFTDVVNATTNSTYTSAPITVAGINHPAAISVSGDASAKYSINNATAVSTSGTVSSGDEVRAVVTSSASAATAVNATVTIGGVSDAFSVTTAGDAYLVDEDFEDTGTPNGWTFSAADVDPDYTSSPISGGSSLYIPLVGSAKRNAYVSFDSSEIINVSFSFKVSAITANGADFFIVRNSTTNVFRYEIKNTTLRLIDATGVKASISYTFLANTVYYVWSEVNMGAATADVYISTTNEKPETASGTVTGLNVTSGAVDNAQWIAGASDAHTHVIVDDVKIQ